jgi:hypothetical protein
MGMDDLLVWNGSWAWGLPLILLNVIFHVIGLGLVHAKGVGILTIVKNDCRFLYVFALVMGVTAILVTLLHASEACIWAGAFRALGVFSDNKSAMLYSLSAITTFGHAELSLAPHRNYGNVVRQAGSDLIAALICHPLRRLRERRTDLVADLFADGPSWMIHHRQSRREDTM